MKYTVTVKVGGSACVEGGRREKGGSGELRGKSGKGGKWVGKKESCSGV